MVFIDKQTITDSSISPKEEVLSPSESEIHAPKLSVVNIAVIALSIAFTVIATILMFQLFYSLKGEKTAHDRFNSCVSAATQLMDASDDLTRDALLYSASGETKFLDSYLDELDSKRNRDKALEVLENEASNTKAAKELQEALDNSNKLARYELYAMRLTADSQGLFPMPERLAEVKLSEEDLPLSEQRKAELSKSMLLGSAYSALKQPIEKDVDECLESLVEELSEEESHYENQVEHLMILMFVAISGLFIVVLVAALVNWRLVLRPMKRHGKNLHDNELLDPIGAFEIQRVAHAYNEVYEENHRRTLLLEHEAQTDPLTGLLNHRSYDKLLTRYSSNIGLAIIDLDLFKEVNDKYGHKVGDEVLKKVAIAISYHFRTTDYACRIGGDEFAVVMTEIDESNHDIIAAKLDEIATKLADDSDGLPAITCSTGIAFMRESDNADNLYELADRALYEAKNEGRARYAFANESTTHGEKNS